MLLFLSAITPANYFRSEWIVGVHVHVGVFIFESEL